MDEVFKAESFVFFTEWGHGIKHLTDRQIANLVKTLLVQHGFEDMELPVLDAPTKIVLEMIRPRMRANRLKYMETVEKRREAGRKGNRAARAQRESSACANGRARAHAGKAGHCQAKPGTATPDTDTGSGTGSGSDPDSVSDCADASHPVHTSPSAARTEAARTGESAPSCVTCAETSVTARECAACAEAMLPGRECAACEAASLPGRRCAACAVPARESAQPCADPGGGRQEKRAQQGAGRTDLRLDDYAQWYDVYPRHLDRKRSQDAWVKLARAGRLPELQVLLDALAWQKTSPEWTKEDGKYIPYPATYLSNERWKDEPRPICSHPRPGSAHASFRRRPTTEEFVADCMDCLSAYAGPSVESQCSSRDIVIALPEGTEASHVQL